MACKIIYPLVIKQKLVGGIPTPLKNMNSSVGMMTFPIYGKIKIMFQTTNQIAMENKQLLFGWSLQSMENIH